MIAFRPVKRRDPELPKAAVARLFDQLGGIKRVAVKLGLGLSQTYALTDPDVKDGISYARVCALTGPDATACAEHLALLTGGVLLPLPKAGEAVTTLTADMMRQAGAASADLIEHMAGGLTPDEAAEALPFLDNVLRAAAQLRTSVAAIAAGEEKPPP